jgi:hypothetical protein
MGPYRERSNEVLKALVELIELEYRSSRKAIDEIFINENLDQVRLSNYFQYLSRLMSQNKKNDVEIDKGVPPSFIYYLHKKFIQTQTDKNKVYTSNEEVKTKWHSLIEGVLLLDYWKYEDRCRNVFIPSADDSLSFIKNFRDNLSKKGSSQGNVWLKQKTNSTQFMNEFFVFKQKAITNLDEHGFRCLDDKLQTEKLKSLIYNLNDVIKNESEVISLKKKDLVAKFIEDVSRAVENFESEQAIQSYKIDSELNKITNELENIKLVEFDSSQLKSQINDLKSIVKNEAREAHVFASDILPLPSNKLLISVLEWVKGVQLGTIGKDENINDSWVPTKVSSNDFEEHEANSSEVLSNNFKLELERSSLSLQKSLEDFIQSFHRDGIQLLASTLSRSEFVGIYDNDIFNGYAKKFYLIITDFCLERVKKYTDNNIVIKEIDELEKHFRSKIIDFMKPYQKKLAVMSKEPMYHLVPYLKDLLPDLISSVKNELITLEKDKFKI